MMLRIELVVVVESSYMEPESMSNTIDLAKKPKDFLVYGRNGRNMS